MIKLIKLGLSLKSGVCTLLFFCPLFITSLFSQEPYYWQLTDEDGLSSMTVYMTIQDKNGLIWVATASGICSYDGKYIKKYNTSALHDQEILKIQEGADGNIWGLNLSGQLFCLKQEDLCVLDTTNLQSLNRVVDFTWFKNKLFFVNIRFIQGVEKELLNKNNYSAKVISQRNQYQVIYKDINDSDYKEYELNKDNFIKEENTVNTYTQLAILENNNELAIICNTNKSVQIDFLNENIEVSSPSIFLNGIERTGDLPIFIWNIWNHQLFYGYNHQVTSINLDTYKKEYIYKIKGLGASINYDELFIASDKGLLLLNKKNGRRVTWSNYSARKIPLTLCNDGQKSKYS
jgi:ligand-binding sensor domain-containing protein